MVEETEYTTITVPESVKEDLDAHRDGKPWGRYLEELRREYADPLTISEVNEIAELITDEIASGNVKVNAEDIAEELKNEISMANEPGVEVDTKSIINRIDDLETTLPRKVAEELR